MYFFTSGICVHARANEIMNGSKNNWENFYHSEKQEILLNIHTIGSINPYHANELIEFGGLWLLHEQVYFILFHSWSHRVICYSNGWTNEFHLKLSVTKEPKLGWATINGTYGIQKYICHFRFIGKHQWRMLWDLRCATFKQCWFRPGHWNKLLIKINDGRWHACVLSYYYKRSLDGFVGWVGWGGKIGRIDQTPRGYGSFIINLKRVGVWIFGQGGRDKNRICGTPISRNTGPPTPTKP